MPASSTAMQQGSASQIRASFTGTGGEMFGKLFVGFLLTAITFGIYASWFLAGLYRYLFSKITFGPTAKGNVKLEFTGSGGSLFGVLFVGGLLTGITFGIYYPWFLCNLIRYMSENTVATTDDGTKYQLKYDGTGGNMFATLFVGMLLTGITFGIYMPWFLCKLQKTVLSQTRISENGQSAGNFDFSGNGGDLFGQYLVGAILTAITFGIYLAWFQVRLNKFMLGNTRATLNGRNFTADFDATGGELFVVLFVGQLLTMITFGIYMFWFMANMIRFNCEHIVIREV